MLVPLFPVVRRPLPVQPRLTPGPPSASLPRPPRPQVILGIFSSTLLSAKSARKLVQCPNLSSLAQELGEKAFTQVEFPLEVYRCVVSRT